MSSCLRRALVAARLKWVPRIRLAREASEPRGAPHPHWWATSCCRHVQEPPPPSSSPIAQRNRCYSAAAAAPRPVDGVEEQQAVVDDERIKRMKKFRVFRTAQQAFQEYLHATRGLHFSDAEHISRHSPVFVIKLLDSVKDAFKEPVEGGGETVFRSSVKKLEMLDKRVSKALARLFQYNPVNEFEPFFESIGLKPSEYGSLVPRVLIFLADDPALLRNYRVLCN